jgi:5'-nucleotidase
MVEALNSMGLTHATVGNHEFDVPQSDLYLRIEESRFKWIVSNVTDGNGNLFPHVAKNAVIEFANDAGEKVRVALIGICTDMVQKTWLRYQNAVESARQQVAELQGKADVFIAMTHLTIGEDQRLGTEVPRLDVLMGGHEHEAATAIVGEDATPIFKADSNARSVCIHRFRFDTQTGVTKLHTQLFPIDASIAEDPETAAIVKRWEAVTYDTLRAQGNEPLEVVGTATEELNGYEAAVRNGPTNLTQLIVETFLAEVPGADAVIFPSGQIRIDGKIPVGDIVYFDVVRIFPMGGKLSVLNLPGSLLLMLIAMGEGGKGTGVYQARANITSDGAGGWLVKGEALDPKKFYKLVFCQVPSAALSYPPFKGSGSTKAYDTRDVRAILTDRLRRDRAKLST